MLSNISVTLLSFSEAVMKNKRDVVTEDRKKKRIELFLKDAMKRYTKNTVTELQKKGKKQLLDLL